MEKTEDSIFRVAFCEPKYVSDVWPKPGSHGRNAMAVIIVINPMSWWFTVTSKLEMQILGEGTSYCGLVFSGKTSPEIASDEEFLGGLVVKTQSFHCRRLGFDPWSGLRSHRFCRKEIALEGCTGVKTEGIS